MITPSVVPRVADLASAIVIAGLVKDYAVGLRGLRLRAVDHVSLSVAPGQIYGLLGPNGSGKSTTIKALLGLVEPDAGECRILGRPSHDVAARASVGYLPESPYFYRHLSGRELVHFYGRVCGLGGRRLRERTERVIEAVRLTEAADRRLGTYSKGMLQRIGLAQALVHDPQVLILDEPTAGVDPVGTAEISELILQLKREGKTVLITSHLLGQIEELCDRVAILDRGRVLVEGAVADLVGGARRGRVLRVDTLPEPELAELQTWLAQRGHATMLEAPRPRLDRVFMERVKAAERDA